MKKIIQLFKQYGVYYIVDLIIDRIRSKIIFKSLGYKKTIILGKDTDWLAGRGVILGNGIRIGRRCRIESIFEHNGKVFDPYLEIGDGVSINDDVHIACAYSVIIGSNVLMASKIFISDHNHGSYKGSVQDSPSELPSERILHGSPVKIGDRVWIGEMVTILPGVSIGEGTIIGSNSVVTNSIPENVIAVGIPARPVKIYDFEQKEWIKYETQEME